MTGSRDREGTVRSLRKRDHRLAVPALWSFFSDCPENKGACGLVAFVFRSRRDQPLQIGIATSTSPILANYIQVSLLGHICFECHTPDRVQTFSALRLLFPRPWGNFVPGGPDREPTEDQALVLCAVQVGLRRRFKLPLGRTIHAGTASDDVHAPPPAERQSSVTLIWTVLIGFVAGIIAKFLVPGDREPSGFMLTALLGIGGAGVATWLGQSLGLYGPGESVGLVAAVLGAVIILTCWAALTRRR